MAYVMNMQDDPPEDEFDGVFDDAPSIEQISEATKWPALQKSRPEDYAEELPTPPVTGGYLRNI